MTAHDEAERDRILGGLQRVVDHLRDGGYVGGSGHFLRHRLEQDVRAVLDLTPTATTLKRVTEDGGR